MTTAHQPPKVDDDQVVTLGLLPHPSRTRRTRVAHPRPGFIAPTATAGGDAPPIDATSPATTARPMASDTSQRQLAPHSFTANTHSANRAPIESTRRLPAWIGLLPWSAAFAAAAFGLVWDAQRLTRTPDLVAGAALLAVAVCGALLVVAQTIGQVQRR